MNEYPCENLLRLKKRDADRVRERLALLEKRIGPTLWNMIRKANDPDRPPTLSAPAHLEDDFFEYSYLQGKEKLPDTIPVEFYKKPLCCRGIPVIFE